MPRLMPRPATALAIAHALVEGRAEPLARQMPQREPAPGSRGAEVDGVSIHAQRMPGRLASPRGRARHAGADPHPSPRHHRPRVLHAGRSHRPYGRWYNARVS